MEAHPPLRLHAGYQPRKFKEEDPVNVEAAERMGKVHDALKAADYEGHALEVLLVRLLFCLFADDTGILPRHTFKEMIASAPPRTGPTPGRGQYLFQAPTIPWVMACSSQQNVPTPP